MKLSDFNEYLQTVAALGAMNGVLAALRLALRSSITVESMRLQRQWSKDKKRQR